LGEDSKVYGQSILGWSVIALLYATLGVFAAGLYPAFIMHVGETGSLRHEFVAIAFFIALGILGAFYGVFCPINDFIMAGYFLRRQRFWHLRSR